MSEASVVRDRALSLAIQAGATKVDATEVAEKFRKFLTRKSRTPRVPAAEDKP